MIRAVLLLCVLTGSTVANDPPGTPRLVEGRFGKALDAHTTPVVIDGNERFRTPPLTVECWAKLSSKKDFNVLVASDHKSSGRHWEIYSYAGSGVFSAYLPGLTPAEIKSTSDICDDKWHYLAMTYDGKQVALFVDGKAVVEQAVKTHGRLKPEAGPLTIGLALHDKHRIGCAGLIDDVRISSTIRKITAVPDQPLTLDIPTVGLWRFDSAQAADVDPAWTPRPVDGEAAPWEKHTDKDWIDPRFQKMDTGPFLNATFRYPRPGGSETVFKGTAIKVGDKGESAVLFDRGQMRFAAAWSGGWLKHSSTRFGLLNTPQPARPLSLFTLSGPGWGDGLRGWDNQFPATQPLPRERAAYRGMYLHGDRVVLSYQVQGVSILEMPLAEVKDGLTVFTRTLEIGPSESALDLLWHELPPDVNDVHFVAGPKRTTFRYGDQLLVLAHTAPNRTTGSSGKRSYITIPARQTPSRIKLLVWQGNVKDLPRFEAIEKATLPIDDLSALTKPGPSRWKSLVTKGQTGKEDGPFAIDTLTVPFDNPYKALFFVGGLDFLPNGDAAVCTAHGDVWLVSGLDDKLAKLTWKRFATGLYQPLGLKVVDGKIVVVERGQLTRLHDLNDDGEADFYENVNNDWHCAGGEHSFDTCLETDAQGNFYFFKTGDTHTPSGGCLLRVSKDGKKQEVFATGFRHPIGLGMSPTGLLTGADQEGNWMPATRIDQYKQGGFYGDMRAHHRATPPKTFDPPLCWLPRQLDNSAGGQVWVPEGKWGPLSGHMLHLSYGKCRALLVLRQQVDDVVQAGAIDLGWQFESGVARGRFHPRDGHLYLVGLRGWQNAAKTDGCLQRVRYTGKCVPLPVGLSVHTNGVRLTFPDKLDPKTAEDPQRYTVEQWNYRWSADYGSQRWSVAKPEQVGQDRVPVKSAKLSADGKSVFLELADVRPVMQMQIRFAIAAADGTARTGVICNTIHKAAAKP